MIGSSACKGSYRRIACGKQGVPQGGVISPLLSNIYLNEADSMLERAKEATRYGKYNSSIYSRSEQKFGRAATVLQLAHSYPITGHCHGALGLRRSRWPGSPTRMNKISYTGYRFPPEIIHQAIWLYLRFTLSLRDVEDLLAERGVAVSYETVRRWVNRFGPMIAADLR